MRQAAIDVVGPDWRVETIVDPGASPSRRTRRADRARPRRGPTARRSRQPEPRRRHRPRPADGAATPSGRAAAAEAIAADQADGADPVRRARRRPTRTPTATTPTPSRRLDGAELLARELGAQIIEEIRTMTEP